jgi:hypothetical protein
MKKIIILTLILILNQGSASAYSDKPVNNLLSEAMEYELNNQKELFYNISTYAQGKEVITFYSGKGYTATYQPKYKEYTFLKDNTIISTIFDSYKKSSPLLYLKKPGVEFILEDKEESRTINYGYLPVDESISFYNMLQLIRSKGNNLIYSNNILTGSFSDDKLPDGFRKLVYSDGKNSFNFKVIFKNRKIESYEIFMNSDIGKRFVKVTYNKSKRVLRWPPANKIIKRSVLEETITKLSKPSEKIKSLSSNLSLEGIRKEINKDTVLDYSFVAKTKDGFVLFNNRHGQKNFEEALCFSKIEEIKSYQACDESNIPEFTEPMKFYTEAILKAIDSKIEPGLLLELLDAIGHSLYFQEPEVDGYESNISYSWFYINVVERYLSQFSEKILVI